VFITPGGFLDAVNKMIAPAVRMEVPTDGRYRDVCECRPDRDVQSVRALRSRQAKL
jgi:hypothetical protein